MFLSVGFVDSQVASKARRSKRESYEVGELSGYFTSTMDPVKMSSLVSHNLV